MKNILIYLMYFVLFIGLAGCQSFFTPTPTPNFTLDEVERILQNPHSGQFDLAIETLVELGDEARFMTPLLAQSLRTPRRDSYLAGVALLEIGPTIEALPELIINLDSRWADTQIFSILALGSVGETAYCTVPTLAPFLWHEHDGVRASAAIAINRIANLSLVKFWYDTIGGSMTELDTPDGKITNPIRKWWKTEGELMVWKECSFEVSQ